MSDDKLVKSLERAVAAVDRAKVPDDLRSDAFKLAWQEMSGQAVPVEAARGSPDTSAPASAPAEEGAWTQLAGRLPGVTVEQLKDVYELQEDGSFAVGVATTKLPKAKTEATRALALLLCAGRQKLIEDSTSADVLIAVAKDYGKFDSPNFAAAMADGEEWWAIHGKGRSKEYTLRRTGWEAAANHIRGMFESEDAA